MKPIRLKNFEVILFSIVAAAVIFAVDLFVLDEFDIPILYLVIILFLYYFRRPYIYRAAALCTVLIVLGFVLSPGNKYEVDIFNHCLAVSVLWVTAIFAGLKLAGDKTITRLASIVESSNDAIIGESLDGTIVSWNQGAANMFGYTAPEILHRHVSVLSPPDKAGESEKLLESVRAGRSIDHYEIRRAGKGGSVRIVSLAISPLRDSGGRVIGASEIGRDITALKAAERELKSLNEELEARVLHRTEQLTVATREMESFSYSIGHDLRAPLRSINGFCEILTEEYRDRLPPEGQRYLGIIAASAQNMGRLIDDLLAFSRLIRVSSGKEDLDLTAMFRSIAEEAMKHNPGRNIRILVEDLLSARGERGLIRQAAANLVANAFKFTRTRPEAIIRVTSERRDREIVYSVSDNGVGFDAAYAHKLFGVFQRLHDQDEFEGNGIGLAIVKRIIHRHHGNVWADGAVDKGATFSFSLPLRNGPPHCSS